MNKRFVSMITLRIFLLLALAIFLVFEVPAKSFAATGINQTINFQGKVTNSDGTNVTDGTYDFTFKIYDGPGSAASTLFTESWVSGSLFSSTITNTPPAAGSDGSITYGTSTNDSTIKVGQILTDTTTGESVYVTSINTGTKTIGISATRTTWSNGDTITNKIYVKNGIFQVALNSLNQDLSGVNFNSDTIYLGANFNSDGEMKPRIRFEAAPYAFNALQVNGLAVTNSSGNLTVAPNASGTVTINTSGNSNGLTLNSATGSSSNSGGITIQTGGTTTSGTSGSISIDVGSGATSNGSISIGTANASSLSIGRNGILTTNNGTFTSSGLLTASAGLTISASGASITGNSTINTSGSGTTAIGNSGTDWNITSSGTLTLGQNSSHTGQLVLADNSSGFSTTFKPSTSATANATYTLPTAAPASNKLLQSDSSGNLSWVTGGSGCSTCLQQVPSADSDNSVVPTTDVLGLLIKQTSAGSPTKNVFGVTDSGGTHFALKVDSSRNLTFGNSTDNNSFTFAGSGAMSVAGSVSLSSGLSETATYSANSGSTKNVNALTLSTPIDSSGTNIYQGFDISPSLGNSTNGTNTVNFISTEALTAPSNGKVNLNAIKIGNLTSATSASENALYIGTGWDNVLSYNGTTVINGSGNVISSQLDHPSLSVNTSGPLGGGGSVSLGSSLSLTCATCITTAGGQTIAGTLAITSTSSTAFSVAPSGSNYGLQVDESGASAVTGLKITPASAGGGLALSEINGNPTENLTLDAKGSGTITLNGTATGGTTVGHGLTLTSGTTLTLTGDTVAGTPTWSSNQAITLSTAAQANVTSLGTLTGLSISGALTQSGGTAGINASGSSNTSVGNSTGTLTLASGGANSWTNSSGNLTIQTSSSGVLAMTSAGNLNLNVGSSSTSTFALASNTASALHISDGSNNYLSIDTRTTNAGSSAFIFNPAAPTIATGGANNEFTTATITPGTLNLTGTTAVTGSGTSAGDIGLLFNQPTISTNNSSGTETITEADSAIINGPVIAADSNSGGTGAITNSYGLNILAGSSLAGSHGAVTNGYGLSVAAPTGASNNYAAQLAGNIIVGAGDAGTPTATTIRGAVASGNDKAGANLTFDASNGTGAGGSGAFIFRTAPATASNSVTFDQAEHANDAAAGPVHTITWSGAVKVSTSHSNNLLVVSITTANSTTTQTLSSVTYNSTGMTFANGANYNCPGVNTNWKCRIEVWYLPSPTADGAAHDVVATVSGVVGNTANWVAGAASFYNADPVTPLGTFTSTQTGTTVGTQQLSASCSCTLNVSTSNTHQMAIDFSSADQHTYTAPTQTSNWNENGSNAIEGNVSSRAAGTGGSVTFNWSLNSGNWVWFGTTINQVANSSADTLANVLEITNIGTVQITGLGTQYGLVYASDTDGTLANTGAGTTGQCMVATTNAAPSWGSCSGSSPRLDQIAGATTTATINNATNAIEWDWNTLTTQTGFKIGSSESAATSGTLFAVGGLTFNHSATENGAAQSITFTDASAGGSSITSRSRGLYINASATSTAASGTDIVTSGLAIDYIVNEGSGAAVKDNNSINLLAPTMSACAGGCPGWDAIQVFEPAFTESAAHTDTFNALNLSSAGALIAQTTSGATINWNGLNIQMPQTTTSTAGTVVTATGLNILGPASAATTQTAGTDTFIGLNIGNITAGSGSETGIKIGTGYDTGILGAGALTINSTTSNAITIDSTSTGPVNIGTSNNAKVVHVGDGNTGTEVRLFDHTSNPATWTNGDLYIGSNATNAAGGRVWVRSNGDNFHFNSVATTADYSEYLQQSDTSNPGDVMVLSNTSSDTVQKSAKPYDNQSIGVVSVSGTAYNNNDCGDNQTAASGLCNRGDNSNWTQVGMLGQVYAKVSAENGPIQIGDPLATSSTVGTAMKATKAGKIIGYALENYDGTALTSSPDWYYWARPSTNSIVVFLEPGYFDPNPPPENVDGLQVDEIKANQIDGLEAMVDDAVNQALSTPKSPPPENLDNLSTQNIATGSALELQSINVDGLATVSGQLTADSLDIKNTSIFEGLAQFLEEITTKNLIATDWAQFLSDVTIKGNLNLFGRPTFNSDTAGFAIIQKGADAVDVKFDQPYDQIPLVNVTITLDDNLTNEERATLDPGDLEASQSAQTKLEQDILNGGISYIVTKRTTEGFEIKINKPVTDDIKFSWSALAVNNAKTAFSTQTLDVGLQTSNSSSQTVSGSNVLGDQISLVASPSAIPAASSSATLISQNLTINQTPLGYLRVRQNPDVSSTQIGSVLPGQTFAVLDSQNSWYEIEYSTGQFGWVKGSYVTINN